MSNGLLDVSSLSFSYSPDQEILRDISFSLHHKSILGIIGPNGGGKSTLLKIIVGLLPIQKGQLVIEGMPTTKTLRPKGFFGHIPQKSEVNTELPFRVCDLLELEFFDQELDQSKITETLELVSLTHLKDRYFASLSGGERQRVLLARAIVRTPKVLVLDEPSTYLDSKGIDSLVKVLKTLIQEKGISAIIVDHNINQILKHSEQILCLNRTHHWHDDKSKLTAETLESIYHCEYEHLLIHENLPSKDHSECAHDEGHHHHRS